MDTFTTERLVAQRLHRDAFDKLCRMHCDTKVMATLGGIQSNEQTRNWLDRNLSHWDQHGYGIWLFHTKSEAAFVGRAGLRNVHVGGNDEVELAYAVMSEFWGQGLATEMAEAILAVAFGRLGQTDVVAFTLPTNQGSRRVMEKAGFQYERDIIHAGLPHVLYRRREKVRKTPIPDS